MLEAGVLQGAQPKSAGHLLMVTVFYMAEQGYFTLELLDGNTVIVTRTSKVIPAFTNIRGSLEFTATALFAKESSAGEQVRLKKYERGALHAAHPFFRVKKRMIELDYMRYDYRKIGWSMAYGFTLCFILAITNPPYMWPVACAIVSGMLVAVMFHLKNCKAELTRDGKKLLDGIYTSLPQSFKFLLAGEVAAALNEWSAQPHAPHWWRGEWGGMKDNYNSLVQAVNILSATFRAPGKPHPQDPQGRMALKTDFEDYPFY